MPDATKASKKKLKKATTVDDFEISESEEKEGEPPKKRVKLNGTPDAAALAEMSKEELLAFVLARSSSTSAPAPPVVDLATRLLTPSGGSSRMSMMSGTPASASLSFVCVWIYY